MCVCVHASGSYMARGKINGSSGELAKHRYVPARETSDSSSVDVHALGMRTAQADCSRHSSALRSRRDREETELTSYCGYSGFALRHSIHAPFVRIGFGEGPFFVVCPLPLLS